MCQFSGDATPKVIPDFNFSMIRFSNDVSFIPVPYLKRAKKSENIKLVIQGSKTYFGECIFDGAQKLQNLIFFSHFWSYCTLTIILQFLGNFSVK